MSPAADRYRTWVELVRRRYRPPIEQERSDLAQREMELREALNRLSIAPLAPGAEAELVAECARLEADVGQLERSITQAEDARVERLRAALQAKRAEAEGLLKATRWTHWRQTIEAADAVLPSPGGRSYETVPPVDLPELLRHSRAQEVRAALAELVAHATRDLAGEADALRLVEERSQKLREVEAEVRTLEEYLSSRQGVARAVLDALPTVAGDRALAEFLDRLANDAAIEASWQLPRDVFAGFRTT